jgi:hypothetical protein
VDSNGKVDPKVITINGYPYPNKLMTVNNGQSSFVTLPARCSDADFKTMNVYTASQGPQNATYTKDDAIYTLNMVNQQVIPQAYYGNSTICVDGVGNAECDADYNVHYNSERVDLFTKTA